MQELICYVNDMIHHATEILFYIREKDYQTAYNLSLSFLEKVYIYFQKASEVQFENSIHLLKIPYEELSRIIESYRYEKDGLKKLEKLYSKEFIKKMSDIETYLFEQINWQPRDYYDENMDILLKTDNVYNKNLYRSINNDKKNISDKYEVNIIQTGDIALSVNTNGYGNVKICSYGNPWQEAMLYTKRFKANDNIKNIFILGFGMGYHVQCLAQRYPESNIMVVENDLSQIKIALKYRNLQEMLLNDKISIIYCGRVKDYAVWLKKIENIYEEDDESTILFKTWKPSIKTISDDNLRDIIEDYQLVFESMESMSELLDENFKKNILLRDEYIDNIQNQIKTRNIVLVAGGPSLDENISLLKQIANDEQYHKIKDNITIICVGKVSRKLLENKIRPDYIIITDAKPTTKWQLAGIEDSGIPLIYISTAAANVVADYRSKRYIVFQSGMPQAENIAVANKLKLYNSGGSVATLAIDIAIRLRAKRVICIGTDMGYKGENTHAYGVGRKISNKEILKEVDSTGGGKILTGKTLNIYRKWIENRIKNEYNTEFINSSTGARINGMNEISFREIVEQIGDEIKDGKKE